jgi:hypothetical protein
VNEENNHMSDESQASVLQSMKGLGYLPIEEAAQAEGVPAATVWYWVTREWVVSAKVRNRLFVDAKSLRKVAKDRKKPPVRVRQDPAEFVLKTLEERGPTSMSVLVRAYRATGNAIASAAFGKVCQGLYSRNLITRPAARQPWRLAKKPADVPTILPTPAKGSSAPTSVMETALGAGIVGVAELKEAVANAIIESIDAHLPKSLAASSEDLMRAMRSAEKRIQDTEAQLEMMYLTAKGYHERLEQRLAEVEKMHAMMQSLLAN